MQRKNYPSWRIWAEKSDYECIAVYWSSFEVARHGIIDEEDIFVSPFITLDCQFFLKYCTTPRSPNLLIAAIEQSD